MTDAMAKSSLERLKWFLIRRSPRGYRLASAAYQGLFDRRVRREQAAARRLFSRWVGRGRLCFDVGANHGARSDVFLALGARVVAIEPQRHCIERLAARFGANRRFSLVPAAVGERPGTALLHVGNIDLISTLSTEWLAEARQVPELAGIGWNEAVEVPVTTLDAVIAEHGVPDFCKIDVEGFEVEVLRGVSRPLPLVSLEYTRWKMDTTGAALTRLRELGPYRFNASEMETMELAFGDSDWRDEEGIRRFLDERVRHEHGYGDLYARLQADPAA